VEGTDRRHGHEDVSFAVARNEIFGILGVKRLRQVDPDPHDLDPADPRRGPDRGVRPRRPHGRGGVKKLINRVSVEASFFKKLSPLENLAYALRLYGRTGADVRRETVETLERLGIERSKIDKPLEELSRGMQQKVAIARAFLTSPVLLLLDEPTTGLDPRSKKDVQQFVRQLRDEHDATILLCTHDMAEAEELCERMAVLHKGRLVALDTVPGLKASVGVEMGVAEPTLEDVFIHLTGRSLDDEDDEGEAA
jgi:ABC-2 type transport system ATP-binding protein